MDSLCLFTLTANVNVFRALVDILALVAEAELPVALGARAHEGPDQVLAPVPASVRLRHTLVHV